MEVDIIGGEGFDVETPAPAPMTMAGLLVAAAPFRPPSIDTGHGSTAASAASISKWAEMCDERCESPSTFY